MSFFDDGPWQAEVELSSDQVACYRQALDTHTTDPQSGVCKVCRVPRCPDWLDAYDKLAAAGQLMATPDRWQDRTSDRAPWRR